MKVYGIWVSDYSNSYVVESVYSSLAEAEAVARAEGGDPIEFEVDPPLDQKARRLLRPGERFYHVAMDTDGNNAQAWADFPATLNPQEPMSVRGGEGDYQRFTAYCWAKDEQQAIKIVNDKRAQWVANGSRVLPDRKGTGWQTAVMITGRADGGTA